MINNTTVFLARNELWVPFNCLAKFIFLWYDCFPTGPRPRVMRGVGVREQQTCQLTPHISGGGTAMVTSINGQIDDNSQQWERVSCVRSSWWVAVIGRTRPALHFIKTFFWPLTRRHCRPFEVPSPRLGDWKINAETKRDICQPRVFQGPQKIFHWHPDTSIYLALDMSACRLGHTWVNSPALRLFLQIAFLKLKWIQNGIWNDNSCSSYSPYKNIHPWSKHYTVNTGLRSMVNFDDDKMTTNATMHLEGCCNTLCWAFCKYFNNYIVVEEDFYKIDVLEQ